MKNEEAIVSEINAFHAQEINQRNRDAMMALHTRSVQLPPNVRPEWLPAEYQQSTPTELRNRLAIAGGKAQAEWTVRQYQTEQMARQQGAELRRQSGVEIPLTGPPVQVEIVPTAKGTP